MIPRVELYQWESRGLGFTGRLYLDHAEAVRLAKSADRDRVNSSAATHAGYGYPIPLDVGDAAEETL